MNEQIKELRQVAAQQADDEVAHLERVHNRKYLIGEWSAIFSDKFAELIVKECVKQIYGVDLGDLKGKAYYLNRVAEHIEDYFGVEE